MFMLYIVSLLSVPPAIPVQVARETVIVATWTCSAPRALATDATATVRDCTWR
jgi:hypothetical protein